MIVPCSVKRITPHLKLDMKIINEYPTKEQMVSSDVIVQYRQQSLCFPSRYNNEHHAPQAYVASLINKMRVIDAIQAPKDPLEVPVGPVTRLRAKRFKEAFNGFLQDT